MTYGTGQWVYRNRTIPGLLAIAKPLIYVLDQKLASFWWGRGKFLPHDQKLFQICLAEPPSQPKDVRIEHHRIDSGYDRSDVDLFVGKERTEFRPLYSGFGTGLFARNKALDLRLVLGRVADAVRSNGKTGGAWN